MWHVSLFKAELLGFYLIEFVQRRKYSRCLLCPFYQCRFVHSILIQRWYEISLVKLIKCLAFSTNHFTKCSDSLNFHSTYLILRFFFIYEFL